VVRGEHDAEAGQDDVEGAVGVRQRFGVRLLPGDGGAVLGGKRLAGGEQFGRQVGRGHPGAGQRRRDRGVAATGGDIEYPVAGFDVARRDEYLAEFGQQIGRQGRVVAARPHRAVPGFHVVQCECHGPTVGRPPPPA
jgi:hypothetical protein